MTNWKKSQTTIIHEELMRCVDEGITDKTMIYSRVVEKLGVPRPTVRRASRELVKIMRQKVMILGDDSRIKPDSKKKLLEINWKTD